MNILDRYANVGGLSVNPLFTASFSSYLKRTQISIFQVRFALEKRINEIRAKPAVDFNDPKMVRLQRRQDALQKTKDGLADTVSLFNTTINAIFDIKAALEEARELLVSIQASSDADFRADIATRFDAKLTKLNNEVDNASFGTRNLLKLADRVNFNTGVDLAGIGGGGVISITGTYVGSEYYIKEADGSYWLLDTTRTRLAEYTSYINYPDGATSTAYYFDDLVVDSYDSSTGAITISGPEAISGTLVRGGLGVVNSFLYNGFAADADVTDAIADIDTAINRVNTSRLHIRSQQTFFLSRASTYDIRIGDTQDDIQDLINTMVDERTAKIYAEQTRLHATLFGLSITSEQGTLLIESLLLPQSRSPGILDFMT
jgi:flagellin-like hook-associated protein FlgL